MTRTTPPLPVDVEARFPEVVPYRRTTTRLHPRSGRPGPEDSSMSGPLLWPAAEPWPTCPGPHIDWSGPAGLRSRPTPTTYVPVLQLFARDVPDLPFPAGTDLLQVLWCPRDHEPLNCPRPILRWRAATDVGAAPILGSAPLPPPDVSSDYVPNPCILHPERVVEHASWDLPEDVARVVWAREDEVEEETGFSYQYHLGSAPGTKVGGWPGWPGWTQDPQWPSCPACGRRMDHLLTVASAEFDGESYRTWTPVEDQPPGTDIKPASVQDIARWQAAQCAPDIMLGDMGGIYVFVCTSCPDRPSAHRFDCS